MRTRRNISLLLIAGLLFCNVAQSNPDTLRQKAKMIFGVLPANMPGAAQDTPEQIALGEKLFFETALSINNSQSCNSCHRIDGQGAGVDNEPTSPGAEGKVGNRNAPTVWNAGFHLAQFWDGRAADLQDQAKGPILNPIEMALPDQETAIDRLEDADYEDDFKAAFPDADEPMTYDNMAAAIAAFERTLITRDRFDKFLKGDNTVLSTLELKGLKSFIATGCSSCHNGPVLGGNTFQKLGMANPYPDQSDTGRFAETNNPAHKLLFKVPGLRDVSRTAPYFHDGSVETLEQAVNDMAWYQLGHRLNPTEIKAITAFLKSLENQRPVTLANHP